MARGPLAISAHHQVRAGLAVLNRLLGGRASRKGGSIYLARRSRLAHLEGQSEPEITMP